MPEHCIPYRKTGYFSSLICDYLDENPQVQPFYNRFPAPENFLNQAIEKASVFSQNTRNILIEVLQEQYKNNTVSQSTQNNIRLLNKNNTFTITTGHQLNLFTGPLFFLYKIIAVANLCKELHKKHPENNFVPVYWMATEDHDFEEINHFGFKGKKVVWKKNTSGAVGRLSTEGLDKVFTAFSKELGNPPSAKTLQQLFKDAYLNHDNLTDATRFLANELFGAYGLVILDADDARLKKIFAPYVKDEISNKTAYKIISKTNTELVENYKVQVNPREINLFYLDKDIRERIVEKNGRFFVNNTNLSFTKEEILRHIDENPECFSPNVLLRPLYQEVILPNICYIGGGGELAYWLQLKNYFLEQKIPFPVLLLRNSALLIPEKIFEKTKKLNLSITDLFLSKHELETKVIKEISEVKIDFSPQQKHLEQQFKALYELAQKTDKSFIGTVAAQEKKQLNGLDYLEKRLLKAQKRKLAGHLKRVIAIQNELFPNGSLQERTDNFSTWYLEYGDKLIPKLFEELKPFDLRFKMIIF